MTLQRPRQSLRPGDNLLGLAQVLFAVTSLMSLAASLVTSYQFLYRNVIGPKWEMEAVPIWLAWLAASACLVLGWAVSKRLRLDVT